MINKELIERMKDMADCADASYAKLHCIRKDFIVRQYWNENNGKKIFIEEFGDNQTLGDTIKNDIKDDNGNILHTNGNNTAYARCIEARFMQDVVIEKGTFKDTTINNDPKNVSELIHHIPNTLSGFSATIFYDIKESNTTTNTKEFENDFSYIITFRDTESTKEIV